MLIAPFGEGSRLSKDAARAAGRVDQDRSGACKKQMRSSAVQRAQVSKGFYAPPENWYLMRRHRYQQLELVAGGSGASGQYELKRLSYAGVFARTFLAAVLFGALICGRVLPVLRTLELANGVSTRSFGAPAIRLRAATSTRRWGAARTRSRPRVKSVWLGDRSAQSREDRWTQIILE